MNNFGFYLLLIYVLYLIGAAIRGILIGRGVLKHPLYDTIEKKKYMLKKGIFTLVGVFIGIIILAGAIFSGL